MNNILLKVNYDIDFIYPDISGYILGLDGYSICFNKKFSIEDIISLRKKYNNKKLFICLNRPIFNKEIDDYKNVLIKLDKIGLDGIIVGDIAALTYNLNTNIILDQLHLNNSYLTINHYEENNVSGIYLTNDITKEEINEIKNKTSCLLFKEVFGYLHLSTSKRKLLSNYKTYFNIDNKDNSSLIKENNSLDYYKIIEDEFGCHILSDKVLNLIDYIKDINVSYFVINTFLLDKDNSLIIDSFINNKKIEDNNYEYTTGFIDKKTIYKVKNNEK